MKRLWRRLWNWVRGKEPDPPPPPPLSQDKPDDHWQWIYGRDIRSWPVTMNLSNVVVHYSGNAVEIHYDRLQQIPPWYYPGDPANVTNVNGVIWLIREFEGQWYIGTFEYIRVGQTFREFHWRGQEKYKFAPKPGDRVGFMVSTMARNPARENGTVVYGDPHSPYQERSNIRWITWSPTQ